MLKFLTSLSFLYAFTIAVLLIYGWLYYRNFVRNGYQRRRFPIVFTLIGAACFLFLYVNIHAPLSLRTFSNLDHHFIRFDGFRVAGSIELGRTDTADYKKASFNRFLISRKNGTATVQSPYSEDPFYISQGEHYNIGSAHFPAVNQRLVLQTDSLSIELYAPSDTGFALRIGNAAVARASKIIRRGSSAWAIFRDDPLFLNSGWYTDERVVNALNSVWLLRDKVSRTSAGDLHFFLSGKLFRAIQRVQYGGRGLTITDIAFKAAVPDQSSIAWGAGFLDNNRNQFRMQYAGGDSFRLWHRFPVSYPLTEENKTGWDAHTVTKFLVSDGHDMERMPAVFGEGFLFAPFDGDNSIDFSPVLLTYRKDKANAPLQLQAKYLDGSGKVQPGAQGDQLILPARSAGFSWVFSIQNSYNWKLGSRLLSPDEWQLVMFGSLLLFFLLVIAASMLQPAYRLSWIWQLLTCVTLVLLSTRFFLYWRYKTFPPYDGLDTPSLQQLNSSWNFLIIVIVTIVLAIIFGFGVFRVLLQKSRGLYARFTSHSYTPPSTATWSEDRIGESIRQHPLVKKRGAKTVFFVSWILILLAGGAIAALNGFDPGVCRHLAIGLMLLYFVFLYVSYQFSPLVASSENSWWRISTGRTTDIVMNNPVKVLLSITLLGLFAFVDIGFAIIFLNFLLFNEAFLCINYAIAGLSAGSRRNATRFGILGTAYLLFFILNLVYGPYIFRFLLAMPPVMYLAGYAGFAVLLSYTVLRLSPQLSTKRKWLTGSLSTILIFLAAFLFFPKQKILDKAAITRYRIDVMTMPVDQAIETAYAEGKTYEPVIRAAQNQWFINTFIYEKNNPAVNQAGFHLLPHAPQNKGARYNAQATDLVASRFFIAEHGKWSVLFYVLLLLVPTSLLASFYKIYPDFTNRINHHYPTVTAGFSLLNYLVITALLVILAATGRYIFFGQDMPFGSILSKQSILFPAVVIVLVVMLFRKIPLEQYPNRRKLIPGTILFLGLALLLFLVKPVFNKDREFGVTDMAKGMDAFIEARLQPVFDYFDTAKATRRLPVSKKDRLFTDSLRGMLANGGAGEAGKFLAKELEAYTRNGFTKHLDQSRILYLDLNSGHPQLAVNDNYFRVEPPPHLQQYWTGSVYSDTGSYNITYWNGADGEVRKFRVDAETLQPAMPITAGLNLVFLDSKDDQFNRQLALVNEGEVLQLAASTGTRTFGKHDTLRLRNPQKLRFTDQDGVEQLIDIQPDAFMKNYFVNGSRYYVYPMGNRFIWARNFAESVSSAYTAQGENNRHAFLSLDAVLVDSLTTRISQLMNDTSFSKGAEYGIAIADGNGRLRVMSDYIKGLDRPDPNDKANFNRTIHGENGLVSQSLLRKQIGNINLLRMNPGPGSTLKPIVFTAVASQLKLDWGGLVVDGFSQKQNFYGGEKVAEYDFEKNNGRISSIVDYLRYSDNYYHSNVLLLGSYSKQGIQNLLADHFATRNPDAGLHWPWFQYNGRSYWLNGFNNWPGYANGKANFGDDSSFVSMGLFNNYGIYTTRTNRGSDRFATTYDSLLFRDAGNKSGFILPEYSLFDQKGTGMDNRKPNEVFMSSFRGHVKGSSQVMIPPLKMVDAFGKMVSQNRNYALTLDPNAKEATFTAFSVGDGINYNQYLSLLREQVFEGLHQVLFKGGTAARLGSMLKNGEPYYYYAKTGTTGDDELKSKSKLFVIVISKKDITSPGFNFRKNKFYTIYFTSQNGPAKQNEEFQAAVINYVQQSPAFITYMNGKE